MFEYGRQLGDCLADLDYVEGVSAGREYHTTFQTQRGRGLVCSSRGWAE